MASSGGGTTFLVVNGVLFTGDVPPVATFLQSSPGAYTTTRTHGGASLVLFWDRHLHRLAHSTRILARVRQGMEKVRPPSATELLLTNDGDRILEGSVTNFFVVCRKVVNGLTDLPPSDSESSCTFVVQTAPISDGVLPGVIRQLVIEICSSLGILMEESAPSWSNHELWQEAFITSSLRLVQHVETIQAPTSFKEFHLKTWKELSWVVKRFQGIGHITRQIQLLAHRVN